MMTQQPGQSGTNNQIKRRKIKILKNIQKII
jgi:hypothetical protein